MQLSSMNRAYRYKLSSKNAVDSCEDINAKFSIGWAAVCAAGGFCDPHAV